MKKPKIMTEEIIEKLLSAVESAKVSLDELGDCLYIAFKSLEEYERK